MLIYNLSKIINTLEIYNLKKNKSFSSITSNSKFTNENTLFVYDKNSKIKNKYLREAIDNKIPAIITNKYLKFVNKPQFLVSDLNLQIELILKKIYKYFPYKTIAITGTNGKTSVAWYISNILTTIKYKNTYVGTIGHYKNLKKINEVELTTPAYEELYKYGSSSKNNKETFIFEASSHALDQNRLKNYLINIATITNITKDHLDYHKNISEYKKAKFKLFTKHLSTNGIAVINSRIKNIKTLKKNLIDSKIKIILYGSKNIYFKKLKKKLNLIINKKKYTIKNLELSSDIELENLECAIANCIALNINEKKIINALYHISNPLGRIQKINYTKKKSTIIIDYAHTPDALKRILKSMKLKNKKPSVLFGCGGERDKSKRNEMGNIAFKHANKIYITDDNPRNENAANIRKNILKHCQSAIEISNRKKAITKAIKDINQNEILVIAGKGHEKYQIIKDKKYRFDDYKIVKKIIKNEN